jgi:DNA-binding MarR family transcriptional regulator
VCRGFFLVLTLANLDLGGTGYCASLNFRRTARAVTRVYDLAMQESGVRSTQFTILVAIAKTQPVSMSKLAGVLIIDRTTLTRSLRLLQKEGMITISKRSEMRQRFVQLTPAGEKALARTLPLWRQAHARFVSMVGTDYWINMQRELESLARNSVVMESALGSHAHLVTRCFDGPDQY